MPPKNPHLLKAPPVDKRELILTAAVKTFAEKGFHGTRVADIAKEADIAYGLIYHYFKNKEEILNSIFHDKWAVFLAILGSIDQDNRDLRTKLLAIAGFFFDSYRHLPHLMEVLVLEIIHSSRFLEEDNLDRFREAFLAMENIFKRDQERGVIAKDIDTRVASYLFLGSIETILMAKILNTLENADLDSLKNRLVDQFLYGIAPR